MLCIFFSFQSFQWARGRLKSGWRTAAWLLGWRGKQPTCGQKFTSELAPRVKSSEHEQRKSWLKNWHNRHRLLIYSIFHTLFSLYYSILFIYYILPPLSLFTLSFGLAQLTFLAFPLLPNRSHCVYVCHMSLRIHVCICVSDRCIPYVFMCLYVYISLLSTSTGIDRTLHSPNIWKLNPIASQYFKFVWIFTFSFSSSLDHLHLHSHSYLTPSVYNHIH